MSPPSELRDAVNRLRSDGGPAWPTNVDAPADRTPEIHYGAVGAFDTLRHEPLDHEALSRIGVVALDVEAAGIAHASPQDPGWLLIRGITDFADVASKEDRWHPYAARNAALYLQALLRQVGSLQAMF